ncbi:MAG: hypothetical protein HZB53_18910 [Chloroflexi bacterium]|nr:hypothetical protein [Chloroflexota bacterium]
MPQPGGRCDVTRSNTGVATIRPAVGISITDNPCAGYIFRPAAFMAASPMSMPGSSRDVAHSTPASRLPLPPFGASAARHHRPVDVFGPMTFPQSHSTVVRWPFRGLTAKILCQPFRPRYLYEAIAWRFSVASNGFAQ